MGDGDLQWDEITFDEEVSGKYWHALIMALHRIREDFIKKQRKMKHLDWYLTMKRTSDKRNPTMVKVTIGKPEDPWCEIDLTEEDVEDWKKGVDIAEEKLKEVMQLPPITVENCHEREDGDLQWDEITFEEEVNGKFWHALIMALHRLREDFIKKQRKIKNLDWYLTLKETSDKRNSKYYV